MEIMRIEKKYGIAVLDDVAAKIQKASDDIANKEFIIAMQLARAKNEVSDNEYDDIEMKDFRTWAHNAFGMSDSTAYNYARIGEHVKAISITKTKKIYRFDLWSVYCEKSGEVYNENCDFTIGQIVSMTRKNVCYDDMLAMCLEGIVSPTMSCRDIKAAVKKWYEETQTDDEQTDDEQTDDNFVEVWTVDGTKYSIPESVLKQYETE